MRLPKLPKSWTTVTRLSKTIALALFILLPILAFFLGTYYQQEIDRPLIFQIPEGLSK